MNKVEKIQFQNMRKWSEVNVKKRRLMPERTKVPEAKFSVIIVTAMSVLSRK